MNKYFKKAVLFLIMLVSPVLVMCEKSPLTDSYLLGEVPDSAAIGRGEAYVGVVGMPFSPYWNPAGLVSTKKSSLGISLNVTSQSDEDSSLIKESYPLEGRKLNFISVCGKQVGFFWRPVTNRADTSSGTINGIFYEETLDVKINMFGITVAVPHSTRVDFGMNINFITGMLGVSHLEGGIPAIIISDGLGWGLDWGLIYNVNEGLNIGVSLLNGPGMIYWEDYSLDRFPPLFRAGVDIRLGQLMTMGFDYEKGFYDDSVEDDEKMHIGIEQYIKSDLIVRGGIYGSNFEDELNSTYTAGVGYIKSNYCIDLAFKQYYINKNPSGKLRRMSISGTIPF